MFQGHPELTVPTNDVHLWHYLDLPAFLCLVTRRALFFSRLTALQDKYEGQHPRPTHEILGGVARDARPDFQLIIRRISETGRRSICCSCWHVSPHESVSMW